jgi:hypothetical protein
MEATKKRIRTRYRVFTVSGLSVDHEVLMERNPIHEELFDLVEPHLGGASPMHIRVLCPYTNVWTDMFIDNMAALKRLPRNEEATKIFRNGYLAKRPNDDPEKLPYIAGPAVVFLRPILDA